VPHRIGNARKSQSMTSSSNMIGSLDPVSSLSIRVMHIRASNFFGGPEKQIVEHLKMLQESGIWPLACSFYENRTETEFIVKARSLGISSFSIRCLSAYDPGQILRLRRLLSREKPELVCTHDYRSTFLTYIARAGLPTRQIAFWRGTTRENLKLSVYYKIENYLLRRMDHLVVVSRKQQASLISHGQPESRISLVPNAVEVPPFEEKGRSEKLLYAERSDAPAPLFTRFRGRAIIATAGRLSPEKGHRYLIEAMPRVLASKRDAVLLIFGDGPLRTELARLADRMGCGDSIHFLGFVPGFASLLRDIDIFVLPSLIEGLPNALLEALAAAKPVVATAVGGVPDLVVDRKTGLLVSPRDGSRLAEAIILLLSDPGLARTMGLAGRESVRTSYSFERQFQLLAEAYSKTLGAQKI
jgi:glycosyltransferase involved in cell wall biosynthesis